MLEEPSKYYFTEKVSHSRKDEYEKGIQEGEKQFALLTERLLEAGRTQDLLRATQDQEYRKLLYKEYQIS